MTHRSRKDLYNWRGKFLGYTHRPRELKDKDGAGGIKTQEEQKSPQKEK